ncbi:MAG: DUF4435 domain-containing protein [Cyanobacteria bacterium P01_F01_bin.86]
MSYLDTLRQRRKTPVAAWHKLRTSLDTGKYDFYVAFEGEEDEEFFSRYLFERFPRKNIHPLICDGKGGVLALHSKVIESYGSPGNVFFFVDSDHDRFIGEDTYPDQVFSTCGYAVENYLYDAAVVLGGIWKHFQLNPADELRSAIERAFERDRSIFERRSTSLMAYAIALRADNQSPKLDLVDLHEIFAFKNNELTIKKLRCAELLASAEVSGVSRSSYFEYLRLCRSLNPCIYIRGKLIAQFILHFCKKLENRFSNYTKLNGMPLKSKIEFGKKNIISGFLDFVEMPQRLSDFLDEMETVLASE